MIRYKCSTGSISLFMEFGKQTKFTNKKNIIRKIEEGKMGVGTHFTGAQGNKKQLLLIDKTKGDSRWYNILDCNRFVLTRVDKKEFSEKNLPFIAYRKNSVKYFGATRSEAELMIKSLPEQTWRGENRVLDLTRSVVNGFIGKITQTFSVVNKVVSAMQDKNFMPLLLDITALLMTLSSPMPNFDSLLVRLLRLYSIYVRGVDLFKGESMEEALMLAALLPLVPSEVSNLIKRMQLFTSKKLLDTPCMLLDLLGDVGTFMQMIFDKIPVPQFVRDIVGKLFSIGSRFKMQNEMKRSVALWKTDKRIISDTQFTHGVQDTFNKIQNNHEIKQFLMQNRKPLFDDFSRLYKAVISYANVARQEPLCVIFEGPPGCKKSYIMNKFVQYDKQPTYTHVVKTTTDGKDFYDGYENEINFVMDDVGQMGISQWRTIINMVSTVKLPLDCAEAQLKDTKFFNSEVLLVTTNRFSQLQGLTKSDGIDNLEALWRRGHVLDFSQTRRNGGNLSGMITYKRYDVNLKTWTSQYIDGVLPDNFPVSVDASNENKVVAWISVIINKHKEFFGKIHASVDITPSQRILIDEYKEDFESVFSDALSMQPQAFWNIPRVEFWDVVEIVHELLRDTTQQILQFLNVTMDIIKSNPQYVLYGLLGSLVVFVALQSLAYYYQDGKKERTMIEEWREVLDAPFKSESADTTSTLVDAASNRSIVIEIHSNSGTTSCLQAFTSGLCILLPYHPISKGVISISGYLNFDHVEKKIKCLDHIKCDVVYQNLRADLCILRLPKYFATPFKNSSKLISKSPIKDCGRSWLVNSYAKIPIDRVWINHTEDIEYYTDAYKNILPSNKLVTYNLSSDGLCGTMLVDQDHGIYGMHVAGNGKAGVSVVYDSKTLQEIIDCLESNKTAYVDIPEIKFDKMSELKDFSGVVLDKSFHIDVPKCTNFVPSPLANGIQQKISVVKQPVNLSAHGPGTIHEMAKKSFQPVCGFKKDELDFAEQFLQVLIKPYGDITDYEVIKGNEYLPKFNMKSVNGMGYDKGKAKYIDMEKGETTELFKTKLAEFGKSIKSRCIKLEDVILYETLKDELRMPEKVNQPRTFRISPLHLVYLMKKLFGDLAGQIISEKWENGIAIGMNPYSDWDRLYNELKTMNVFDGDVGQWDGKQPTELQEVVSKVLNDKYIGNEPELMEFFSEYLIRVNVAIMNKTLQTTHSVSSGYWMTALGNSILNRAHSAVCFFRSYLGKFGTKPTVAEFMRIKDFVLGDDKLVGVPSEYKFFNAVTMGEYFNSIGMTFTDGFKKPITSPYMSIWDVTFLKRKFKFNSILNKIMCPLDVNSIFGSLCYFDRTKDLETVMKGKLESAQRELWLNEYDYKWIINIARSEGLIFNELSSQYLVKLFIEEPDMAWKLYLLETGKTQDLLDYYE